MDESPSLLFREKDPKSTVSPRRAEFPGIPGNC
jgi:hypothetical protein